MNFLKMPEDVQTYLRNINDHREAQYLNEKRLRHILYLGCEAEKVEAFRQWYLNLGDRAMIGAN